MSGICGLWNLDGQPVGRSHVPAMVDALGRRGPDGSANRDSGSVGFGYAMLRTSPEAPQETLPCTDRNGNVLITADVRLDNRTELIEATGLGQGRSDEISDSQLILHAYDKWGDACPAQLLGDFAFALWDRKRHQLLCARDHLGVKLTCPPWLCQFL